MAQETVGLYEELTAYVAAQLEKQRKESAGNRVIEFDEDGNPLPDGGVSTPPHLADAVAVALEMDRLKEMRAMPVYPTVFSPYEWTCFSALIAARIEDQANEQAEREWQQRQSAERARLEQLRRK